MRKKGTTQLFLEDIDYDAPVTLDDGTVLPSLNSIFQGITNETLNAEKERIRRDSYEDSILKQSPERIALLAAECRMSFFRFSEVFWPIIDADPFLPGFHHKLLSEHLQYLVDPHQQDMRELLVNGPPRHGKSQFQNVLWMPWDWLERPWTRWVFFSKTDNIVMRDSKRSRDILQSRLYKAMFGDVGLRDDSNNQKRYDNRFGGFRFSVTIKGGNIGEGGDRLIVDDPEDPLSTKSAAEREYNRDWFNAVFMRRANDPVQTVKVLFQHRVGPDDMTSYIRSTRKWQSLVFTTEYEPDRIVDPRNPPAVPPKHPIELTTLQQQRPDLQDNEHGSGRKDPGDLLWPAKHPRSVVEDRKKADPETFSRQDQQRPEIASMRMFAPASAPKYEVEYSPMGEAISIALIRPTEDNQIRRTTYPANAFRWFQVGDTAFGTKKRNDSTAIGTFGIGPEGAFLVWHYFCGRVPPNMQYEIFDKCAENPCRWDAANNKAIPNGIWPGPIIYRAVEKKGTGFGIVIEGAISGNPIFGVDPGKEDKETRAADAANLYRIGNVFHPAIPGEWYYNYASELEAFPFGQHDDMVDCVSYGVKLARKERLLQVSGSSAIADTYTKGQEEVVQLVRADGTVSDAVDGEDFEYIQTSTGPVRVDLTDPLAAYYRLNN